MASGGDSRRLLDIGAMYVAPNYQLGHSTDETSHTHRHVYHVKIKSGHLDYFLLAVGSKFRLVSLINPTELLLQIKEGLSDRPSALANHTVVRGRTPSATKSIHDDCGDELWHLPQKNDYIDVYRFATYLYDAGAHEAILVTAVNPVGVTVPSPDLIEKRTASCEWVPPHLAQVATAVPSDTVPPNLDNF